MENTKPIVDLDLYLIRHGQSHGNIGYEHDNITVKEANDPYLTPKGVEQATAAGEYFKEINFDAFYSSGLLRAVQTSVEIMEKQSEDKTLNIQPLLTEVGIQPEYEGVGIDEIRELWLNSQLAEGVDSSQPLVIYSSFDKEEELFERAEKTMNFLLSKYQNGEKVAVISHAAFLTVLIFHIMGFTSSPLFDIDINNTGITRITFYKKGTNKYGDVVFRYINNTSHLS